MRTRVATLLVLVSCSGSEPDAATPSASTGEVEPISTTSAAVAPPRSKLLRQLRAHLDELAPLRPDKPVSRGGKEDLSEIVGLTRDEIRAGLGTPNTCTENPVQDESGNRRPVAPCVTNEDWFYSFYKLPEGWLGGGPELLLQFDPSGRCTNAVWRFTQ